MALAIGCKLTQNITRTSNCGYNLAEINKIYLANLEDIAESGITIGTGASESCEDVTAIDSGITWYLIEPAKGSASFTDELVVEDNGGKYRTHTITFNITGKYDKDMVCPVDALSLGRFFVVVATADGEYLALGRKTGLEASEQSVSGGGDSNGITVTLSANVTESAVPLSAAAIAVVKGE